MMNSQKIPQSFCDHNAQSIIICIESFISDHDGGSWSHSANPNSNDMNTLNENDLHDGIDGIGAVHGDVRQNQHVFVHDGIDGIGAVHGDTLLLKHALNMQFIERLMLTRSSQLVFQILRSIKYFMSTNNFTRTKNFARTQNFHVQ